MKTRTFLFAVIALLFSTAIMAQSRTTFGIRGGINFYNLNGKNNAGENLENKLKTGFNAGVNAEIPVGIDFYLQPGLLFSTKGAADKAGDGKTTISYLELPINFIYKPELGEGKMLLGFGPYLGYGINAKYKNGSVESDIEFGDQVDELKRFDAGANLLAGYEFNNKLSFQLNAGLGLLDIHNSPASDSKSTLKNTGFGLSLGYRF